MAGRKRKVGHCANKPLKPIQTVSSPWVGETTLLFCFILYLYTVKPYLSWGWSRTFRFGFRRFTGYTFDGIRLVLYEARVACPLSLGLPKLRREPNGRTLYEQGKETFKGKCQLCPANNTSVDNQGSDYKFHTRTETGFLISHVLTRT